MHSILERQIKKWLKDQSLITPELQGLFEAVSDTYTHQDEDRALIERSLDLSSKEMIAINTSLRQERDRAKAIITSMREGLIVVDKDRNVVSINPAAERMLDAAPGSVLGKKTEELCELFHSDKPLGVTERPIAKTLQDGISTTASLEDDLWVRTSNGRTYPVALSTEPLLDSATVIGAVLVFRDITDEREATNIIEQQVIERTQEVQKRRAELVASIATLDLGFILTDINLSITMTNPAAEHILGVTELTAVNTTLGLSLNFLEECKKCITAKRSAEYKNITYKNQYINFYLSPILVDSEAIGAAIILEDVTEARIMERSKDEFFSIASHELRTPLTAIRGYSSLVKKKYANQVTDPKFLSMINGIQEESTRLINIVNDFLDTSRLEQKRLDFSIEAFDICDIVHSAVDEFTALAEQKNIQLQFVNGATIPTALGDKERTKQILINVLDNAFKFTQQGSVRVQAYADDNYVGVSVHDTGRGVPEENQTLLFHKFQQAGSSIISRDVSHGTGLGLYISRLLAEGMGGTVWLVKSVPDVETIFAFVIPRSNKAPQTPTPTPTQ